MRMNYSAFRTFARMTRPSMLVKDPMEQQFKAAVLRLLTKKETEAIEPRDAKLPSQRRLVVFAVNDEFNPQSGPNHPNRFPDYHEGWKRQYKWTLRDHRG